MSTGSDRRILGVFSLTMINVAAIISLRNYPMMAHIGWQSIFFYVFAGFGFFIPAALVSAELATGWPSRGVYTWVKEAFGERWGFVAIWMQWIENVIYYPAVLSFAAATLAYLIDPSLAENKAYILSVVLFVYWFCTFVNFFGMRASSLISSIGVIGGVFIPSGIIILLGIAWLILGHPSQIPFSGEALIPVVKSADDLVFMVGVFLGLCGIEMSAVHAREVTNPQKDYPRAILFSTAIILGLSLMGSLAISIVIPSSEISLVEGIMQAFTEFFRFYHIEWMTPIIALMVTLGPIAAVTCWIVGPSKGLFQTSEEGYIPPVFHKRNKYGMPTTIMIFQGVIVTLLCFAFLLMPSVNSSYWILNALAGMLYLIMYILLFAAAIRLRYKRPDVERDYRVPGGRNFGMWIVAGIGFISSTAVFCLGFVPPGHLHTGDLFTFELFLCLGVGVMFIAPLVLFSMRKESWKNIRDISEKEE